MPPFFLPLTSIDDMKLLLPILLSVSFFSRAQVEFDIDSMRYSNRIGGRIDSVDIANSCESSIQDGGLPSYSYQAFQTDYVTNQLVLPVYLWGADRKQNITFSALPHLGFAYGIGAQATQFVRAEYQQAFSDSTILNVNFFRNSSNGYLRNSTYAESALNLRFVHRAKRFALRMDGAYNRGTKMHPGGIATDTLIELYGLEYTPVKSQESSSQYKKASVDLTTFTQVVKREHWSAGMLTRHSYSIVNRVYSEADTIYALYQNVYIDSFETYDQVNLPLIQNAAGLFFTNQGLHTEISASHRYWRLANFGLIRDTVETSLQHALSLKRRAWYIRNQFDLNLTGAFSSHRDELAAGYRNTKLDARMNFQYLDEIPHPLQRYYYGNNYNFQLASPDKNKRLSVGLNTDYQINSLIKAGLKLSYTNLLNQYYLLGSEWRNDTLQNYQFGSIEFNLALEWKWLNIRTQAIVSSDPHSNLPLFQSYSRVYIKTRLFKAKKLELIFGAEPVYISDVKPMGYVQSLDYYSMSDRVQMPGMFNTHAFLNLGIDEFRFYFRFENIGYFWNNKTQLILRNYPLPEPRFRVGITWDFFN